MQCLLQAASKEARQRGLERSLNSLKTLKGFERQGEEGGVMGCVISSWTSFLLVGGEVVESASSTFWFQLVWGLHACGHHTVNFFHLVEDSVSAEHLKGHGSEYYL